MVIQLYPSVNESLLLAGATAASHLHRNSFPSLPLMSSQATDAQRDVVVRLHTRAWMAFIKRVLVKSTNVAGTVHFPHASPINQLQATPLGINQIAV